jgi:hypothetical protein
MSARYDPIDTFDGLCAAEHTLNFLCASLLSSVFLFAWQFFTFPHIVSECCTEVDESLSGRSHSHEPAEDIFLRQRSFDLLTSIK